MTLAEQIKELSQLHAQGTLTDEQFEKAKDALIAAALPPGKNPRTLFTHHSCNNAHKHPCESCADSRLRPVVF